MKKFKLYLSKDANQNKLIPFFAVGLGFVLGAIVMLLSGFNPLAAYSKLLQGAGIYGNLKRFGDTLLVSTPLILGGLAVAFGMRTGLFNIGVSGQMLMGGAAAVTVGVLMDLPKIIHLPFAVIVAVVVGALWGSIPGYLKAKFNVHEVVVCIMMNWIAVWSVYWYVPLFIKGKFDTESAAIKASASLRFDGITSFFNGSYVNTGLLLAILAAVFVWWVLEKTTFGFELKAVGFNKDAAHYAGIKVNRNIVYSMMISGALAGLAGATFYLGYTDNIKIGELPSLGFDGIAVALLGLNTPIGVVLSSLLFGVMNAGKGFMQTATKVPNELVQVIIAVIIFFSASTLLIKKWIKKFVTEKEQVSESKGGTK